MAKSNWPKEPRWEVVHRETPLSTPELQDAFITLLEQMDRNLFIKRWPGTGRDPEFLLEKWNED